MDIFRNLGSGSLSVSAMLDYSGEANTSIHGLGEDDTAKLDQPQIVRFEINALEVYSRL